MVKTAIGTITVEIRCQGVTFSTPKDMEEFARIMIKKHIDVGIGVFEAIPKMNTFKLKVDREKARK